MPEQVELPDNGHTVTLLDVYRVYRWVDDEYAKYTAIGCTASIILSKVQTDLKQPKLSMEFLKRAILDLGFRWIGPVQVPATNTIKMGTVPTSAQKKVTVAELSTQVQQLKVVVALLCRTALDQDFALDNDEIPQLTKEQHELFTSFAGKLGI